MTARGMNIRFGAGAPNIYGFDALPLTSSAQVGNATFQTLLSGQLIHGSPFTVTGSGFGTKLRAIPPILVDRGGAPTGTMDSQWSLFLPNSASIDQNFVIKNRDAGFSGSGASIGTPDPYTPRIIAGCATAGSGSDNTKGSNICMGVPFDRSSVGADYALFYSGSLRADPLWTPDVGSPNDNNFKTYCLNETYDPFYHGTQFGYLNYTDNAFAWAPSTLYGLFDKRLNAGNSYTCTHGGTSASSGGPTGTGTGIIDGGCIWDFLNTGTFASRTFVTNGPHNTTGGFASPDANGHSSFYSQSLWPMYAPNGWIKQEILMYCTASTTLGGGGRIDVFENCNRTANICGYRGYTDAYPAATTNRAWLVGGYNRDYGASAVNNWRYFGGNIIFDIEWGVSPGDQVPCVFIGNNPVFGAVGSIHEPQVADTWTDGSIHIPFFWKGRLPAGTGYKFVQPRTGSVISAGAVTIAASP